MANNDTMNDPLTEDIITIGVDSSTVDFSGLTGSSVFYSTPATYANTVITSNNPFANTFFTTGLSDSTLKVNGDADIGGDLKIKGASVLERLEKIEKRLSILQPDLEKLEHFEALRKAYEHYKTLEALCEIPPKEDK